MPPRSARIAAGQKHAPRAERNTASAAQEPAASIPSSAPSGPEPSGTAHAQQESSGAINDSTAPEPAASDPPAHANESAKPLKFQPKSAYTRRSLSEREARERADQGRATSASTPHKTGDAQTQSQRVKGRPPQRNTPQITADSSARTQRPSQTAARPSTQVSTGSTKFPSRETRSELAATGILGGSAEKSQRRKSRAQTTADEDGNTTTADGDAAEQQADDDEGPIAAGSRPARKRKVPDNIGPDAEAQGSPAGGKQDTSDAASRVIRKAKGKAAVQRDQGSKLKSEAGKAASASHLAASRWKEETIDEKPVWDDTDEQYSRINIEQINLVSSDGEDDSEASFIDDGEPRRINIAASQSPAKQASSAASAFRPVRLERQEHVSRAVGVNTEASSSTSAELRKRATGRRGGDGPLEIPDEDAVEVVSSRAVGRRRAKGTAQDGSSSSVIKQEPNDAQMELDNDIEDTSKTAFQSSGRRQLEEAELSSTHPKGRRGYLNPLPPGTVVDDANDPEMRAIFDAWKEVMAEAADGTTASASRTANPSRTDASELGPGSDLEGKHFLLQLPPIMPRLAPRNIEPNSDTSTRDQIKTESSIDAQQSNAIATVPEPPATNDLSGPADSTVESIAPSSSNKDIFTATDDQFPIGRAGSVTVYESGKMVADWGGVAFELQPAPPAGLLQQVLTYEQSTAVTKVEGMAETEQWEETTQLGKEAWDLGPIQGGLIATPDLEALLRDQYAR